MNVVFRHVILFLLIVFSSQSWSMATYGVAAYEYDANELFFIARNAESDWLKYDYDDKSNLSCCRGLWKDSKHEKIQNGSFSAFEVGLVATKEVDKFGNEVSRTPKSIQDQMTVALLRGCSLSQGKRW